MSDIKWSGMFSVSEAANSHVSRDMAKVLAELMPGLEALDERQREAALFYTMQLMVESYLGWAAKSVDACQQIAQETQMMSAVPPVFVVDKPVPKPAK